MSTKLIIRENVHLAPFTTIGVGGPARFFVEAGDEDSVAEAITWAHEQELSAFILGGGSNLLISDDGYGGLVINIVPTGIDIAEPAGKKVIVEAAAGENWDKFVEFCVERELSGVECLSGIPGLVGGTPIQNVGAYGQEVSETIVDVRCYDRNGRRMVTITNDQCGFGYRKSIFNTVSPDRYVVLSVRFALEQGGQPKIVYKDLIEYFNGKKATLKQTREAVLQIRRSKSMVIDMNDPDSRSVGSFFKNPVLEKARFDVMKKRFGSMAWFDFEGKVKIPAAWLIEQAGVEKGFVLGKAAVSRNHSLALVNRGDARASDIIALKKFIQAAVMDKFGILLEPEPQFIGFKKS